MPTLIEEIAQEYKAEKAPSKDALSNLNALVKHVANYIKFLDSQSKADAPRPTRPNQS